LGIVACANPNRNSNDSQFFFTLEACPELNDKHTIFGKVTGDTRFNLLRFNSFEVDGDKPIHPPIIKSTEVVNNPFNDISLRIKKPIVEKKEVVKKKGIKNLSLLSFGDEAQEEFTEVNIKTNIKIKSALPLINEEKQKNKKRKHDETNDNGEDEDLEEFTKKRKLNENEFKKVVDVDHQKEVEKIEKDKDDLEQLKHENRKLMREILSKNKIDEEKDKEKKEREEGKILLEERRKKYLKPKETKRKKEEVLKDKLFIFRETLHKKKEEESWMNHKVVFSKEPEKDPMARKEEEYTSYDPRLHKQIVTEDDDLNDHAKKLRAVKKLDEW